MKIGDYVRTKNGMIAKIINQLEVGGGLHTEEYVFILDNGNRLAMHSCKVIKSSPNIIDLIEVGDYVNGSKVLDIAQAPKKAIYTEQENGGALLSIVNNRIESILTKEQFKNLEYKL